MFFGTREHLKNNYLYRMGAAVMGIWGNSAAEAMYPTYYVDDDGQKLDGTHRYTPWASRRAICRRSTRSGR